MVREELESMRTPCEVYARVCGYIRPTTAWNEGKVDEFGDRKMFKIGGANVKEPSV